MSLIRIILLLLICLTKTGDGMQLPSPIGSYVKSFEKSTLKAFSLHVVKSKSAALATYTGIASGVFIWGAAISALMMGLATVEGAEL